MKSHQEPEEALGGINKAMQGANLLPGNNHAPWLVLWSTPTVAVFCQLLNKHLCFLAADSPAMLPPPSQPYNTHEIPGKCLKASQKLAISTSCQLCAYNARLVHICGANLYSMAMLSIISELQRLPIGISRHTKCDNKVNFLNPVTYVTQTVSWPSMIFSIITVAIYDIRL